jgi:WD40 repeat protein
MANSPLHRHFSSSHAFLIGVDQYQHLKNLRNAVNDAKGLAAVLRHPVHDFQVHPPLLNATYEDIKHLLTSTLPQVVQPNDRVLLYFAGHGIALDSEDGIPRGYLLPSDASRDDETHSIAMQELYQAIGALPCKHFFLILDCCFSGAFRWSEIEARAGRIPKKIFRERFDRYVIDPAWQVLTSAAYNQEAIDVVHSRALGNRSETDIQHSPFVRHLIDALRGAADLVPQEAPDGLITATELYLYIRDKIESETIALHDTMRQTPSFFPLKKHDKGEFLFLSPLTELNLPHFDPQLNPYKGLMAYELDDHNYFYGREEVISRLLPEIEKNRFTVVTGASGTGKSSLVKAGILPALVDQGYRIYSFRPGVHPVQSMHAAIATMEELKKGPALILIDQFEELITRCMDEGEKNQFLDIILSWIEDESLNTKVLITIRSDFESPFLKSPLSPYWNHNRFTVPPFSIEEFREIIERPATQRVLYFDPPELVDTLIEEVVQAPGALPLLSFTLYEIFEIYKKEGLPKQSRALSKVYHDRLGGIAGALQNRAGAIYEDLDQLSQLTLQKVFLRMVNNEGGELTGRRVLLSELGYRNNAENERVAAIIDQMVEARLIIKGADINQQKYIEPAHDALIYSWLKLRGWIRTYGQETLSLQSRLSEAVKVYHENDQDENLLYHSDPRLDQLRAVSGSSFNWLNAAEEDFIEKSYQLKVKRRRQFIRNLVAVIVALLGLTTAAVWFGLQSNIENRKAQANALTTQSVFEFETNENATKAFRLAQRALTFRKSDAALSALYRAAYQPKARVQLPMFINLQHQDSLLGMDYSEVANVLLTYSADTSIKIWDLTGALITDFSNHQSPVLKAVFAPNGQLVASIDRSALMIWDLSGKILLAQDTSDHLYASVTFTPDSKHLVLGSTTGELFLKDLKGRTLLKDHPHEGAINWLKISPNDEYLVSGSFADRSINLWKGPLQLNHQFQKTDIGYLTEVEFSADGQSIFTVATNSQVNEWDLQGKNILSFVAHEGLAINDIALSPDDNQFVTTASEPPAKIWNPQGQAADILTGHQGRINGVLYAPSGSFLVTTSEDGTARKYTPKGALLSNMVGHENMVFSPRISEKEECIITASYDRTAKVWMQRFSPSIHPAGHSKKVFSVTFDLSGDRLITTSGDSTAKVWTNSGALLASLEGHTQEVIFGIFMPNEPDLVITGAKDNMLRLWRLSSSSLLDQIDFNPHEISALGVSADGSLIAAGFWNGQLAVVEQRQGTLKLIEKLSGHVNMIESLQMGPKGKTIFTGSRDNKAILWEFGKEEVVQKHIFAGHQDWVKLAKYHPSQPYFLTASEDRKLMLWSSEGTLVRTIRVNGTISSLVFNSNGDRMLLAIDRHLQLWELQGPPENWKLINSWEAYQKSGILKAGFIPGSEHYIYTISNSMDASEMLGKIWTAEGTLLAELGEHQSYMTDAAVDPNGEMIVTTAADGEVIIWPIDPGQIIAHFDSLNIFKYPF